MSGALQDVAWEQCLVEPRPDPELQAYARRKQGIPQPMITCFAPVPWMARALIDLHGELGLLMHLDQAVADLVVLVVSQENACRYCYAGVRLLMWAQGMPLARIQRIESDLARADLPPRTVAALAFARSQSRSGPPAAPAAVEALRQAGYGTDEMKEIAFIAALTDFSNRAHTFAAIPAHSMERLPEQWHMRLFRPLVGWFVRRHRYRGQATAPPAASFSFGDIARAYAGSPMGLMLEQTLQGMWASPHLTRRCKLLMLAVVARGLECDASTRLAAGALRAEGVDDATLARILTQLDAPELDQTERLLVPFARETIWYEPAIIQRRARALKGPLADAPLLEAIGVASLANGLCRMHATLSALE